MPLPINIHDLLRGKHVESERLEFKKGWNPRDVLHTICAFANDFHNLGGGYVIVGVAESQGRPILPPAGLPVESLDGIQKEILNLGFSKITPAYHPVVEPVVIDDRHVLVIWAPGGDGRPYKAVISLAKGEKEQAYFIRKASSTVRARGEEERELLSLAAKVPFDDRINQQARLEDLSRDLMREFLHEVGSNLATQATSLPLAELGRQMHIIGGPDEAPFPLNVGLLFFNPEPHRFFPATQIDVVWFPEGAGGDRFTEKTFRGPLHRMVREALDYVRRNYLNETIIKHPDRAESTHIENFPYAAVEEAIVNAIYHRSYEEREPVEVRISPQEFIVLSYPGPDRSIRLDQLRAGRAVSRRYRNRRIGEFLKELEFTEGRATGIPKIIRSMRDNGLPLPEFEFDADHSYFLVRLPAHPAAIKETESAKKEVSSPVVTISGTKSALSRHQVEILRKCEQESAIADLMNIAERSDRTKFRNQVLSPLLADGLIEMTIPGKPTSSKQRYRTTHKGGALLASLEQEK
ncbi:MAG: putative DNA binding domain-containing protein [Candidatus Sumerlaeota bacterium]|nr:putative DNA binding domain-containing protein [Candidatus Sumerlaeota bacterium]